MIHPVSYIIPHTVVLMCEYVSCRGFVVLNADIDTDASVGRGIASIAADLGEITEGVASRHTRDLRNCRCRTSRTAGPPGDNIVILSRTACCLHYSSAS